MPKVKHAHIPSSKHAGEGPYVLEQDRIMELALRIVKEIAMPDSRGPSEAVAALFMAQKIVIMIMSREQPNVDMQAVVDEISALVNSAQIHLFADDEKPENPS
jgi:hypothetical protein